MRKYVLSVLSVLALLPVLAWAGPGVGSPAPDFAIPDTAYVTRHLTEWRGQVVMLFFWQST